MSRFLNNVHAISSLCVKFGSDGDELKLSIIQVVREVLDDPTWYSVPDTDIAVSVITGGLTNVLYLAHNIATDQKLVVRVFGKGTELFIDRVIENTVFARVSSLKLGPTFYGMFQNGRIEGYINSRSLSLPEVSQLIMYQKIAKSVAKFHSMSIPEIGESKEWLWNKISFFSSLACGISFDGERGIAIERLSLDQRRQDCAWLKSHLQELEVRVAEKQDWKNKGRSFGFSQTVTHNDLHSGNFLLSASENEYDSDITLIDYEYSAFGHRAYDVGNSFNEICGFDMDLTKFPPLEQRREFLRQYLLYLAMEPNNEGKLYQDVWKNDEFVDGFQAGHSNVDFDYVQYAGLRFGAFDVMKKTLLL